MIGYGTLQKLFIGHKRMLAPVESKKGNLKKCRIFSRFLSELTELHNVVIESTSPCLQRFAFCLFNSPYWSHNSDRMASALFSEMIYSSLILFFSGTFASTSLALAGV